MKAVCASFVSILAVSSVAFTQPPPPLPPLPPLPAVSPAPRDAPVVVEKRQSKSVAQHAPAPVVVKKRPTKPAPAPNTEVVIASARSSRVAIAPQSQAPTVAPPVTDTPSVKAQLQQESGDIVRGGSYFGIGMGYGVSNLIDETFAGNSAAAFNLRFGGVAHDQVLVGVHGIFAAQYNDWGKRDIAGFLAGGMAELMVFPVSSFGWNLSAAAGYGYVHTLGSELTSQGGVAVVSQSDHGFSWMVATGYDFFAGRGLNVGLQARYHNILLAELDASQTATLNLWFAWY